MKHLLGIRGLSPQKIRELLESAYNFVEISDRDLKKVPALRGKTVVNLFLEPSTRTRASFEIAAKRLSADTLTISESGSSIAKGESLFDTLITLQAMNPDVLVIRHRESGAAHFAAKHLDNVHVVNAGDGMHEHPTQALLDALTLKRKLDRGGIEGLKIAIVGDVFHSRVARSNVWLHLALGNEVRLVAPRTLVPKPELLNDIFESETGTLEYSSNLEEGVGGVDVVLVLRMQRERQQAFRIPSLEEYAREYQVRESLLEKVAPNAVVLHPGPMNRGIEIESEVADGPRSLIVEQVRSGIAVRMAVLFALVAALKAGGEIEASH